MRNSFVILVALSLAVSGFTADFHVSTSGANGNPGTVAQPWRTIQFAADSVGAGDTVHIHTGAYNERVVINVSGSAAAGPVVFRNAEGETASVDGGGLAVSGASGLIEINGRSRTASRFTVTGRLRSRILRFCETNSTP